MHACLSLAVRFAFSLPILLVASYYDLKYRQVPNKVWLVFLAFAVPSLLLEAGWASKTVSIVAVWSLALVMFYAVGFGGADSKALMCLTLAFPSLMFLCATIFVGCILSVAVGVAHKDMRNNLPFVAFVTVGVVLVPFLL